MTDDEFRAALRLLGRGERSFAILRSDGHQRPLAASEQIADQIEEDIARELIAPGAPLREQALAERFGVSRGPIRDALHLLQRDGLVKLWPNRGAVVTHYARDEMRHIAEISWPITRLHLGKVFERASSEALEDAIAAQQRVGALLSSEDGVGFALSLARLTMTFARFGIGLPGEAILQVLYRPSIRYTIAGLQAEGASERALPLWREHIAATERRDVEAATRSALLMLRNIHLPVLA